MTWFSQFFCSHEWRRIGVRRAFPWQIIALVYKCAKCEKVREVDACSRRSFT